jgi:hypothetical protein
MRNVLIFSKVHKNKTNFKKADTPGKMLEKNNKFTSSRKQRPNRAGVAEPPNIFDVPFTQII